MPQLKFNRWLPVLALVGVLVLAAACSNEEVTPDDVAKAGSEQVSTDNTGEAMEDSASDEAMMGVSLPENIVAPHFVGSLPLHGDALSQAPVSVVLTFNLSLNADSSIMVTRGGEPVPIEVTEIAEDRLSMRASLDGIVDSGVYQVDYTACWLDGSCHEGTIGFSVDPSAMNG